MKFEKNLKILYTYFEDKLLTAASDFTAMFPFITPLPLYTATAINKPKA